MEVNPIYLAVSLIRDGLIEGTKQKNACLTALAFRSERYPGQVFLARAEASAEALAG